MKASIPNQGQDDTTLLEQTTCILCSLSDIRAVLCGDCHAVNSDCHAVDR